MGLLRWTYPTLFRWASLRSIQPTTNQLPHLRRPPFAENTDGIGPNGPAPQVSYRPSGIARTRFPTMTNTPSNDITSDAHRLIEALPEHATWNDVMYRVYVRQCIDAGIEDAHAGRVIEVDEVRRRFGLPP